MEIVITRDFPRATHMAAGIVRDALLKKSNLVLGLATGRTPLLLYAELIRMHREEQLDFSGMTSFNLDEYVGLPPDHPSSYAHYMKTHFFDQINARSDAAHLPDGMAEDFDRHAVAYEEEIRKAGGIDIQILGIGEDGHIGFNEPSSSLASRTRIKTITETTFAANAHNFGNRTEQPRHVITMGVGTILEARQIILLAEGEGKARAVARMVEGPVSAMVPASALQLHPQVHVFVDEKAGSRLKLKNYYRWVYENDLPPNKYGRS